ncbi:MAG: hypothetical protein ACI9OJ_003179 [Myxococcota bacterium]
MLELAQAEVMAAQTAAEERHKGDAKAAEQKKKVAASEQDSKASL